jgi:hypothetical protein
VGVLPEEVEGCAGHDGACSEEGQVLDYAIPGEMPHQRPIGCGVRYIKGHLT